jgi:hypothetical protein
MRLLAACLLTSLGCGSTYLEDLPEPVAFWVHETGPCSSVRAVDGERRVYDDQGCEDGRYTLDEIGVASVDKYEAVMALAGGLPGAPVDPGTGCNGPKSRRHLFGLRQGGTERVWVSCGTSRTPRDPSGLEGPFLELATRFNALP